MGTQVRSGYAVGRCCWVIEKGKCRLWATRTRASAHCWLKTLERRSAPIGDGKSFKVAGYEWGSGVSGAVPPIGSGGKAPSRSPRNLMTVFFVKICYFEPVLRYMHDYTNQFNMKWKENQFGGRKVVGQAIKLAHLAQKVDERLSSLSSRLRRQCQSVPSYLLFVTLFFRHSGTFLMDSGWLIELRFCVPLHTIYVISETLFPANLLAKYYWGN